MAELRGHPSAGPAWGGGHLSLDAIVAYVDEELSPGAHRRALEHLSRCPGCAAEVVAQTQARWALRASAAPSLPSSLLSNLRAIPRETEIPGPPAGLAVGPDGQLVSMLREPRVSRKRSVDRRVRLGAGAVVSGLALGALIVSADAGAPAPTAAIGGGSPAGGGGITAGSLASLSGYADTALSGGVINQPVLNVPHPSWHRATPKAPADTAGHGVVNATPVVPAAPAAPASGAGHAPDTAAVAQHSGR